MKTTKALSRIGRFAPRPTHLLLMALCALAVLPTAASADDPRWLGRTGWVSAEEVCMYTHDRPDCLLPVTGNGLFISWAGRVTDLYWVPDTGPSRVRVVITWRTNDSQYQCGQQVEFRTTDVADFTHRSFTIHRCN